MELARVKAKRSGRDLGSRPPEVPIEGMDSRQPSPDQIRAQAEKILQTKPLSRNNRTRKLLQYIVEQTLAGNARRLKQYSIATEALGRGTDFDPDTDPIVRLEASKLRRALDDYYLRTGFNDPIRISVPKGGYVPTFDTVQWRDDAGAAEATAPPATSSWTALSVQRLLILPFHMQVTDEGSRALTNGLFEQLNVELARYQEISLVTFRDQYSDAALDPILAGTKAQSSFVVSGSARQSGDEIRVTVRLHDVRAGSIIWIECFDLHTSASRGLQAEENIARHIAGAIADYYGVISHTLSLQSVYSTDKPWNLQDTILRHRYLARTLSERVYRVVRADLEYGTTHAAHHPVIWAALGHTIFYGNVLGFDDDENWMALVYRYAQRAFELDHKCALAHVVMALHGLYQREHAAVIENCKRLVQYNPHAPSTKLSAGFFRALAGDWDVGTEMMGSALSVLLHPPGWVFRGTFLNYYRKKRYNEALEEIGKYHAPDNFTPPLLRAAALAQLGRKDEAANVVAEALRICPRLPEIAPRYFQYLSAFDDLSDHLRSGLRKAGLKL